MQLSPAGRSRLKRLEGFTSHAIIPVPGDPPTIGHGFTHGVKIGDEMTLAQADARLITEVLPYERAVSESCTQRPNQNQFDAMVLLAYNIGTEGFKRSTVLKAHNRGDHQAAARAFALWNKAGGKVYNGLTRRRAEEAALYLQPMPDDMASIADGPETMPRRVDGERSMADSEINRAGVVAGGTAAAGAVAEAARTAADVKYSVASLGDWLLPILLLVVVGLCGYIVWQRVKQRREGWS